MSETETNYVYIVVIQADVPQGAIDLFDCINITPTAGRKGYGFDIQVSQVYSAVQLDTTLLWWYYPKDIPVIRYENRAVKNFLLLCAQVAGRLFNLSTESEEEQNDWITAIKHSLKVIQDIKVTNQCLLNSLYKI